MTLRPSRWNSCLKGLLIALPLAATTACQAPQTQANKGFPIGAVIALTGSYSIIGQDQRIGLELAQQVFGQREPKTELSIEDGGSDELTATNAFRSQISRGVIGLIGPSNSQQAFAADPLAERAGVPVVAASNTANGIPEIGAFISRVSAPVSVVAPLSIAAAIRLNPGVQRTAIFYTQDDAYSTSEFKNFEIAANNKRLKIITVQRTNGGEIDFQKQINDTLNLKPELIVISAGPSDGGNLVRQLRELGFGGPIVAGNGMNSPNIFPVCQRYCDGLLIAQAYSPETPSPINKRFLNLYKQRNQGATPPQFSAQAFTAYQVIHQALQALQASLPKGTSLTSLPLKDLRQRLNRQILSGTYATPLGVIGFTPNGEIKQNDFYVAQVKMNPDGLTGRFRLLP
jgi:branched-chain amino acid transport system substrate-binding protein